MSHEFLQTVSYTGGRDGRGELSLGGVALSFTKAANMGGPGGGTNPEELLLGAMGACYSLTLGIVVARALPAIERVAAQMEATVEEITEPKRALRFAEIRITPHIHMKAGEPAPDPAQLKAACEKAENACFITQTVKPGAGKVTLRDAIIHSA